MSEKNMVSAHQLLEAYEGDAPHIFFSYSHENCQQAQNIISQLQFHGFRVWYDATGIKNGEKWRDTLKQQVRNCAAFLLLISSSYMDSHWCLRELEEARENSKEIIAIYLEDIPLKADFNDLLHDRQNVVQYFRLRRETFYDQLFKSPVLFPCRSQEQPVGSQVHMSVDPRINPGILSGNHCIITLDMMAYAYPRPLQDDVIAALKDNQQDLCPLTVEGPSLADEAGIRGISAIAPFSCEITMNRFISVSSSTPMPEDDPEQRTEYLNHFCAIMNPLFNSLFQNGVTDLHLFSRGPIALLPFVGQAAGPHFRLYYYQYSREKGRYYRVGAQSKI